ncbi:hypothetical protein INT45_001698 [Circinella minor]|uniref:Uncharacterized protein n=1 Tax=Circinella minor TaxID=1195481 RepID=A0A8H7VIN5_9FUNG|nr:hypothetical protein INT45_001698 [Circinella minor]
MADQSPLLLSSQPSLGSTFNRSLCFFSKSQTSPIHELAMGSGSSSHQRPSSTMETMETGIRVPSLELNSIDHTEDSSRESGHNNHHTKLDEYNMVPNTTPTQQQSSNSTTISSTSRTRRRSDSSTEESSLAFNRMAHKRQRLMDSGLQDDATNIMLHPSHNHQRTKQYQLIQQCFIKWASHHQINPFTPNPTHLINFLAYGHVHHNWTAGTCTNYKSAILDLYDDTSIFYNNRNFQQFFIALNEQTIRSFDRPKYDISPLIQHLIQLGDNITMRSIDLTRKTCFLLAITGFLRPSDIECIDAARTKILNNKLSLIIVKPKEKQRGQPIEKSITIRSHTNPLLCPIKAYINYRDRFCEVPCTRAYPIRHVSRRQVHRFIRHVHNNAQAVGSERISNHIKYMIDLIPRPEGSARPKARALGSTVAIESRQVPHSTMSWFMTLGFRHQFLTLFIISHERPRPILQA